MGSNKKLKKRKKRATKKKSHRNAVLRAKRREQALILAEEANWVDDPTEAIKLLKKAYKILPEHDDIEMDLIHHAKMAGDEETVCRVVLTRFNKGRPCYPPSYAHCRAQTV